MLNRLVKTYYHDKIYTTEPELFYKLYKWELGLFILLSLRKIIGVAVFGVIGIIWLIFIKPRIFGLDLVLVGLILFFIQIIENIKTMEFYEIGLKTQTQLKTSSQLKMPSQIRTLRMRQFIRRFVSKNGKALGRKEWKAIKKYDIKLYNDLLSDKCNHCCYYYSLEIARIIKDSTLIWGMVEDPMIEGHNYCAHAIILRNGYIYDSNMHQSEKYEDFIKLYKFKPYKQWNYNEYSRNDFRESERAEFRKWCKENNVSVYEKF